MIISRLDEIRKRPAFLLEAARYFSNRDTHGEDRAHWANVYNAENCKKIADEIVWLLNEIDRLRTPELEKKLQRLTELGQAMDTLKVTGIGGKVK